MKRKVPKHIQDEIDKEEVTERDIEVLDALVQKAYALGLVAQTSNGFYPTQKGAALIEVLPKPDIWFNTNDERIGLIAMAMNDFVNPYGEES